MAEQRGGGPPDPTGASGPAELVEALRLLRGWAGQPALRRLLRPAEAEALRIAAANRAGVPGTDGRLLRVGAPSR